MVSNTNADGSKARSFPFPVLLCDIGGTNVRLAELPAPDAAVKFLAHLATGDHPDLAAAIDSQRASFAAPPRSLIVCAAGPVEGQTVKLTNARWTLEGRQLLETLGLAQGLLLNDFEAQAIMVPSLRSEAIVAIGHVPKNDTGTRLVIGPGTGLGVGLLVPWEDRLLPLMSEAGHTDFGPVGATERAIWTILQRSVSRVSGESLLSGPGTVRLYDALCEIEGVAPATDDAAAITQLALRSDTGIEAQTLRMFWTLVARFSGRLALGMLAKGGVTLSGGILKKIVTFLDADAFRQAFDDQAPLQKLVAKIPVTLVTDDHALLDGLAGLASHPGRFMIDYTNRLWRPSGGMGPR